MDSAAKREQLVRQHTQYLPGPNFTDMWNNAAPTQKERADLTKATRTLLTSFPKKTCERAVCESLRTRTKQLNELHRVFSTATERVNKLKRSTRPVGKDKILTSLEPQLQAFRKVNLPISKELEKACVGAAYTADLEAHSYLKMQKAMYQLEERQAEIRVAAHEFTVSSWELALATKSYLTKQQARELLNEKYRHQPMNDLLADVISNNTFKMKRLTKKTSTPEQALKTANQLFLRIYHHDQKEGVRSRFDQLESFLEKTKVHHNKIAELQSFLSDKVDTITKLEDKLRTVLNTNKEEGGNPLDSIDFSTVKNGELGDAIQALKAGLSKEDTIGKLEEEIEALREAKADLEGEKPGQEQKIKDLEAEISTLKKELEEAKKPAAPKTSESHLKRNILLTTLVVGLLVAYLRGQKILDYFKSLRASARA